VNQNFGQEASVLNGARYPADREADDRRAQEPENTALDEDFTEADALAPEPGAEADPLGEAVGSVPSGLFVVTTGSGEEVSGYLASFIQQVSIDPLILMIAMSPTRPAYQQARRNGELVIHVLGRTDNGLVRQFWNGLGAEELKSLPNRRSEVGTPILEGVLSYLRCRVLDEWKGGDHAVLFVAAEEGAVLQPDKPYFYRRANGRGY
jgi:flavin reductase (DIM6/NTAB) family NADH-FMN oxidoreductase RutF